MATALVESYRAQTVISSPAGVMALYDGEERLLQAVLHGFNQSQSLARDLLLMPEPRTEDFLVQLAGCEAEVTAALDQLSHVDPARQAFPDLRSGFQEYFRIFKDVSAWPESERARRGPDLYRDQYSRSRNRVSKLLRDTAEANQSARSALVAKALAAGETTVHHILLLLGADLLLALGVAGLNLVYARELGRESLSKVQEIAHAKTEMQQLSARLLTIQEEERHRLSRDLHDGIGQLLTALRIEISHLGLEREDLSTADRERLQRARKLAEEATRSTRDIALLLRPSHLDDLGLEAALQWLVEDFSRRTGIGCHFIAAGLEENLPEAWKTCVYRIVQEAIHNCEKHAAPARVQIRISREPEVLTLEVQDDGTGFELDGKGAPLRAVGLGILGMRERAAMLGGALQIISAPGRGTTVRLALPVSQLPALQPESRSAMSATRQVEA